MRNKAKIGKGTASGKEKEKDEEGGEDFFGIVGVGRRD